MNKNKFYDGYEKLKTVGKGAFGTATLYRRLNDNKYVVMKEIYTMDMDSSEKLLALNEVEVLSTLNHPNIIRYLGSFEKEGLLIIIMEYADGGNLAQLIKIKKNKNDMFTEKGILNLLGQISFALAYMHKRKILHRDLKTANIFLNMNGIVKIGDFGISKILNTRSQAQTVVGTPYYLSPEMCEGSDYNEKSDIWAIGCILYELATFRKPFDAPTLPVLVQKITTCDYDDIPNTYSDHLSQLIKVILQKNFSNRPSAQYICDTVIPNIIQKINLLDNIDSSTTSSFFKSNITTERSILYEVFNFGAEQNVISIELPHKRVIDFSVSSTHQLVITSDNLVYVWGENNLGQLGLGALGTYEKHPTCVNYLRGKNIIKCAAGTGFSIFLNTQGILFSCGDGRNGCLGQGDWNSIAYPTIINSLVTTTKIAQINCGDEYVAALSPEGNLYTWGSSKNGELGQGHTQQRCKPLAVNIINSLKINNIYCGKDATILLTINGQVLVCGNNEYNKLGISGIKQITLFTPLTQFKEKIKDVSLGVNHTIFLTDNGVIVTMGRNVEGQLGKKNNFIFKYNSHIFKMDNNITMLTCGANFTVAADDRNVLWFWGSYNKKLDNNLSEEYYEEGNKNTKCYSVLQMSYDRGNESVSSQYETIKCITNPQSILAFYASPENIQSGNIIYLENIKASTNSLFVLAYTTTPPPVKHFTNTDLLNSNFISQHEDSNCVPSTVTNLPNTPRPI